MELEYNAEKNKLIDQDQQTEFDKHFARLEKRILLIDHELSNLKDKKHRIQGLMNDLIVLYRKLNSPRDRTAGENEEFRKRVESTRRRLTFLFEQNLKLRKL